MQKRKTVYFVLVNVFFIISFCSLIYPDSGSIEIVLLIDSSGSMATTDPSNLRLQAARSFVDLINVGDRIGVIDFSTTSKILTSPTVIDREDDKNALKNHIDRIGSHGEMTDILTALASAFQLLQTSPGKAANKATILLTDGKLEIPNSSPYYERQTEAIDEICKMYQRANIKIISVGFTEFADIELLDKFAKASDGRLYIAKKDTELLKVYTDIFADLKQLYRTSELYAILSPQSPYEKEILVDKYVKEVTFAVNRSDSKIEIEIRGSDGEPVGETNASNTCVSEAIAYKIVRVFKPKSGNWKISIIGQGYAHGQVISTTDLLLELSLSKLSFGLRESINIEAYLVLNNNRITDPEILNEAQFKIKVKPPESPDGKYDEILLVDNGTNSDSKAGDGIFTYSYAGPEKEGEYILYAEAKKMGVFERKKNLRILRGSVFKFLTHDIDIRDVIKGENGTFDLRASSSYAKERIFTPSLLTFTPKGDSIGKSIDFPKLEPKEIKFAPGKDSRAYVHMNTNELPYGMYEGKLKLFDESLKDELIIDFRMNVVPPPPPPNPILAIVFIIMLIILGGVVLFIILKFYKKRLPKFSGILIWESEGSSQQFALIGPKRGIPGMLGVRSCKIKIGSSSSADIRLFGVDIETEHIFLKAEKDSRGRKTNIVIYPVTKKEVFVNDNPLGCSSILKHDDVINIGGQKLRFEDFNREVEGQMYFENRYI